MNRTVIALSVLSALLLGTDADAKGKSWKGAPHVEHFQIGISGGRLGAQVQSMTEELRAWFGAPSDAGVLVGQVEPDSPAAKAGLRVGDVVIDVDGEKVDSPTDLITLLSDKGAGAKVSLKVVRDKRQQTLAATLRDRGNARAKAFRMDMDGDMDMDMDMDFDFDMPPAMRGFAFGRRFDHDAMERLEKKLDDLSRRLEKLEKTR